MSQAPTKQRDPIAELKQEFTSAVADNRAAADRAMEDKLVMGEFIHKAIFSNEALAMVQSETDGVSGWHLNGEVATWDSLELELPSDYAKQLIAVRKPLLRVVIEHQQRELKRHRESDNYWGSEQAIREENRILPIVDAAMGFVTTEHESWVNYCLKATAEEIITFTIEQCQAALEEVERAE